MQSEELHNVYALSTIIMLIKTRRMRWMGHEALMEKMRNVHKILVRKHEGKRPLGRPTCRLENNI
jgi:hypothetical protein